MFAFVFSRRDRTAEVRRVVAADEAVVAQAVPAPAATFWDAHPALDVLWRVGKGAAVGLALGLAVIFGGDLISGRTVSGFNDALPPPTPFWNTPFPMGMAGPTAPLPFLPASQLASGTR